MRKDIGRKDYVSRIHDYVKYERVCTMYGTLPLPIGVVTYCCDLQHVAVSPYNVTLNSSYLVDLLDLSRSGS